MRRQRDEIFDGKRRIIFEHEWREDFVGEALSLELNSDNSVLLIEFYSAQHGIVIWTNTQGLGLARSWENEAERDRRTPNHTRYFPVTLLNDYVNQSIAHNVIESVCAHFKKSPLGDWLQLVLDNPTLSHRLEEKLLPPSYAKFRELVL